MKYKLGNYRTKLRGLGCPEVTVNALKHKPDGKCRPAYGVKKPKKAEVSYCPAYPTGETAKTLVTGQSGTPVRSPKKRTTTRSP